MTKVDPAGQFTHDQDVQPTHHLWTQAGGLRELRIEKGRAQVGEQTQPGSQPQEPLLGTAGHLQMIPFRPPHGAEQDAPRLMRLRHGLVRQRPTSRINGRAPDQRLVKAEPERKTLTGTPQDRAGLLNDVRADAVAREKEYVLGHAVIVLDW